jgi:hypothetical protein
MEALFTRVYPAAFMRRAAFKVGAPAAPALAA